MPVLRAVNDLDPGVEVGVLVEHAADVRLRRAVVRDAQFPVFVYLIANGRYAQPQPVFVNVVDRQQDRYERN